MWREGLEDGNKEVDDMLISAVLALKQEVLVMENNLTIHIFHQNPEGLEDGGKREKEKEEEGCGGKDDGMIWGEKGKEINFKSIILLDISVLQKCHESCRPTGSLGLRSAPPARLT